MLFKRMKGDWKHKARLVEEILTSRKNYASIVADHISADFQIRFFFYL